MPPGPKSRTSRSKRGMRRSHNSLIQALYLRNCPRCQSFMKPHHICLSCGYYKNRAIIEAKS